MDGEHFVIAATISWLLKAVYECRFHWQVGVLRGRVLSQVAPYLIASAALRSTFIIGLFAWLSNHGWSQGIEWPLVATASLWFLIERLLRVSFEGALMKLGPLGHAAVIVCENLSGLDSSQWTQIRAILQRELIQRTAELRRSHGRRTSELIKAHRQTILRHLRMQRSLAWLIGGEWYRGVFAKQLDRTESHMDGLYFEILVNSIGVTALPRPEQPEERGFQRKLAEGHMRVTIIPRPDQPESHEQVRVIDSSFRGLRVKATAALETLQRGDRVLVKSGRNSYDCELAWLRNGQAGLVMLRTVAPPAGT
ncbi:MAG: hypothetical protein R3F29_07065 [Planctomycetota bacterium]